MKLKTYLRQLSLPELQSIAEFWGLPPADPQAGGTVCALADHLYPRMQSITHFRPAFDRLEPRQRDWLYFLALHGGELPVEEMRRRCGSESVEAFNLAVKQLSARGFLRRKRLRDPLLGLDLIGIPEPFVRMIDLPPYWQGFLGHYLQTLSADELRAIAAGVFDLPSPDRRKQTLVHFIRRRLLDPKILKETLARRTPAELEMFQQILQKHGVCAWKDLLDSGVHKKFDHARADRLRELVECSGLVFVFRKAPNKYNNLLMVPRDIAYILQNGYHRDDRTIEELSRAGVQVNQASPREVERAMRPGVILDNSNNILRDLVVVCSFIHRNQVKMLNNGGIGRNDLKKAIPLLSHNKTIKYVAFLALFAIVRKHIIAVGSHWRVSGSLLTWLQGGQACFRDLYDFWINTNEWNEEYLDGDVLHADSYPQNLIGITELRKLILRSLEKTPSGAWIDFETFAQSLLPQVAVEIPGRADPAPAERCNRHPLLVIEAVVAETLYWLGVTVLGVADLEAARTLGSRPNEAIAPYDPHHPISPRLIGEDHYLFCFKLTEFGAHLMTRPYLDVERLFQKLPNPQLPYASQSEGFTVQPNLEIVTPPDFSLERFFRLLQFTDIKKVDIMTTLAITRETVRRGLDFGLTAEDMLLLLEQSSRKELPETVHQMIGECQSRHGEVDMGLAGGYLRVSDRMRLEEIRANPKIAPSIKDVLDDKLILLSRTADFQKVARELQKMGFMPRVDSESLHVTHDGLFQITLRAEELYDLLAVLRFATLMEEEAGTTLFEDRVQPIFQRLSLSAQDRFNPKFYAESIARAFFGNYEKLTRKLTDEATGKYRKQLNRLMAQVPSREPTRAGYKGPNPASDAGEISRLLKFAIEHEAQVKIHYVRSSGETVDHVIEPEALQGKKIYAFCPQLDEHHVYALDRVHHAAL